MQEPDTERVKQLLAEAFERFNDGDYVNAEPRLRDLVSVLPGDSRASATCLKNLGEIAKARGQFSEAIRLNLRVLSVMKRVLGEQDPRAVSEMDYVAGLYSMVGRAEEAQYLRYRAQILQTKAANPADNSEIAPEPVWLVRAFAEANGSVFEPAMAGGVYAQINQATLPAPGSNGKHPGNGNGSVQEMHEELTQLKEAQVERLSNRQSEAVLEPEPPIEIPLEKPIKAERNTNGEGFDTKNILFQLVRLFKSKKPDSLVAAGHSRRTVGNSRDALRSAAFESRSRLSNRDDSTADGGTRPASREQEASKLRSSGNEGLDREWPAFQMLSQVLGNIGIAKLLAQLREKSNMSIFLVGLVFLTFPGMYLAEKLLPRTRSVAGIYAAIPHAYRSADGSLGIDFEDAANCIVKSGEQSFHANCNFFLYDWRDYKNAIFGALVAKQYWLEAKPAFLQFQNGLVLYPSGGAEIQLTEQVEQIASKIAESYSIAKAYPMTEEEFREALKFTYRNPLTKKKESPAFTFLSTGSAKSSEQADFSRIALYDSLDRGKVLDDEEDVHPGAIHCIAVHIKSPRGPINVFCVRAYGEDGKAILNTQNVASYVALEDGKRHRRANSKVFSDDWSPRARELWFTTQSLDGGEMNLLRYGGSVFFGSLCILLLLLKVLVKPEKHNNIVLIGLAVIALLFAILYGITVNS
jgi:hypothetical protein